MCELPLPVECTQRRCCVTGLNWARPHPFCVDMGIGWRHLQGAAVRCGQRAVLQNINARAASSTHVRLCMVRTLTWAAGKSSASGAHVPLPIARTAQLPPNPAGVRSAFIDIGYLKPQVFLLFATRAICLGTGGVLRHLSTLRRFLSKPRVGHRRSLQRPCNRD
jgi:hypothetical protein